MSDAAFIHEQAIVEPGAVVGPRTRIWAFAHVLPRALIGEDCNVCDHVFIENDVVIGDRVTIKCGVYVWDGARIEDDVFLGPNVAFTNDIFPRSKHYPPVFLPVRICCGASIGANATILPNIRIGQWSMIGAGSVVTRSVPDFTLVLGNPARVIGHVCVCTAKLARPLQAGVAPCERCGRIYYWNGSVLQQVEEASIPGGT